MYRKQLIETNYLIDLIEKQNKNCKEKKKIKNCRNHKWIINYSK